MPRTARLDTPGLLQHVIVRGIDCQDIFWGDGDRRLFCDQESSLLQEPLTGFFDSFHPDCLHPLLSGNR